MRHPLEIFNFIRIQVLLQINLRWWLLEVGIMRHLHVWNAICLAVCQIYWWTLAHQVSICAQRDNWFQCTMLVSSCVVLDDFRAPQQVWRELITALWIRTKHKLMICILIYSHYRLQFLWTTRNVAQRCVVSLWLIIFMHFHLLVVLLINNVIITHQVGSWMQIGHSVLHFDSRRVSGCASSSRYHFWLEQFVLLHSSSSLLVLHLKQVFSMALGHLGSGIVHLDFSLVVGTWLRWTDVGIK
jgi:hypothetical protein